MAAGFAFAVGIGALAAAAMPGGARLRQSRRTVPPEALRGVTDAVARDLRLAGITPRRYVTERIAGLAGGIAVGAAISFAWADGIATRLALTAAVAVAGWQLPRQSARDTARKRRAELDQTIRLWIVLAAQQVAAGSEPATAMLTAAGAGTRPAWTLLRRHLLAAQHQRRPAWEGLADLVDRYGLDSLAPAVAAFGLAAQHGTRVSDAVLAAADTLWSDTVQREREAAERRSQIIVLPATGVALALAAILIYPPFVSLTGGLITQAGTP